MNDDKRSFILYADIIDTVKKLPIDDAGELFLMILQFANDQEPMTDNLLVEIAFDPIKRQMQRDSEKWKHKREKLAENGRMGGRPKKANGFSENPKKQMVFSESKKSLHVTVPATATVPVSAPDTLPDNVKIVNTGRRFTPPTRDDVDAYAKSEMIGSTESVDKFHDHYTANGWRVGGKTPMKDWKAAFRNWIRNEKQYNHGTHQQASSKYDGVTSSRSRADWEALQEWGKGIDEYREQLFSGIRQPED